MVNVKDIAEGWINFIRDKQPRGISEDVKNMAEARAEICKECPSLVLKEFTIMRRSIFKYRCEECGCGFPMMTYSTKKKCPKGKWPHDTRS